jgi:hypothetical protein
LAGLLDAGVTLFGALPGRIATALQPVALNIWNAIGSPLVNVLNNIIENVNQFIDNNEDFGLYLAAAFGLPGLAISAVNIEPVTIPPPTFAAAPQAAKGGLFGKGVLSVGERGQEYIANASSKLAVFPNNFVQSMNRLSQSLNGQSVTPVYGSGSVNNTTTNNRTQNNTMNFIRNEQDMMQRMAILKAYGGG